MSCIWSYILISLVLYSKGNVDWSTPGWEYSGEYEWGMKAEKMAPEYDFVNFPLIATGR